MVNILNGSIKGAKNNNGRNAKIINLPLTIEISVMHPIRISNIKTANNTQAVPRLAVR